MALAVALVGMRHLCGIVEEVNIHAGFKLWFVDRALLLLQNWLICSGLWRLKMPHRWR